MALPSQIQTVTVTGSYLDTEGEPCKGTITFTPPCRLTDSTDHVILAGPVTAILDSTGSFAVTLPCTTQEILNPTNFTYEVTERLSCSSCARVYHVAIPCDRPAWDIAELVPVDSSPGTIVIRGPQGPPGPASGDTSIIALDPIDVSGLGSDADPYVIALDLSAQEGNALQVAPDGGLYVPDQSVTPGQMICIPTADEPPPTPGDGACLFVQSGRLHVIGDDGTVAVVRPLELDSPIVIPCDTPESWLGPLTLGEPTVMQSMAVDSVNGYIYTTQVTSPATTPESTRLSQLTMDGTLLGSMTITGSGHPTQFGIDVRPGDTDPWIYIAGVGQTRITRVKYRAGTTIASTALEQFNPFAPGAGTALSVNVDPVHRLIAVGSSIGATSRRFTLYDLDEAVSGLWFPRGSIDVPMGDQYLQTVYQGMATYGGHLYVQSGWGFNDSGGVNQAYTAVYDWATGQRLHLCLNEWNTDLEFREPEGLAMWILDYACPDQVRLVQGFADGPVGARVQYLNYWDAACTNGGGSGAEIVAGSGITVTGDDPVTVATRLSTDAGNALSFDADGGLYAGAGDPTALQAGSNITVTGTGQTATPYVVGGYRSTVTAGTSGTTTVTAQTVSDRYTDYRVDARVDPAAGNQLQTTASGLYVPPPAASATVYGIYQTAADWTSTATTSTSVPLSNVSQQGMTHPEGSTSIYAQAEGLFMVWVCVRASSTWRGTTLPPLARMRGVVSGVTRPNLGFPMPGATSGSIITENTVMFPATVSPTVRLLNEVSVSDAALVTLTAVTVYMVRVA